MSLTERLLVFDRDFLEDLAFWVSTDRKIALKILSWSKPYAETLLPVSENQSLFAI
jgi:hypothetical protein